MGRNYSADKCCMNMRGHGIIGKRGECERGEGEGSEKTENRVRE